MHQTDKFLHQLYIEKFKKEYNKEDYKSALSALMNNKVVNSWEL